jgi:WD40 repeat protein
VVTGSSDRTAHFWSLADGQPTGRVLTHGGAVSALGFSPDGRRVVTLSKESTLRLWAADAGGGKPERSTGVPIGSIARLWSADDGQPVGRPMGRSESVAAWVFSSDSRLLLIIEDDGTAQLWNTAAATPIGRPLPHRGPVAAAGVSPDGRTVVTARDDKTAQLWDTRSAEPAGPPMIHEGAITAVAFSPDSRTLLVASDDKTARLWNPLTAELLGQPMMHPGPVTSAAFCPDGETILTSCSGRDSLGQFSLWNAADGTRIGRAEEGIGNSSPGSTILFCDQYQRIIIYNSYRFRSLAVPRALAGSPDLRRLAVEVMTGMELGADQVARVLDAATWRERSQALELRGGELSRSGEPRRTGPRLRRRSLPGSP